MMNKSLLKRILLEQKIKGTKSVVHCGQSTLRFRGAYYQAAGIRDGLFGIVAPMWERCGANILGRCHRYRQALLTRKLARFAC